MLNSMKRVEDILRRGMVRRHLRMSCGLTAAAFILAAGKAHGALIQPISSADVPVFNTASVFDTSHAGNSYSLEPGTNLDPKPA